MSDHTQVYGYCENKCKVPVYSEEQTEAAIANGFNAFIKQVWANDSPATEFGAGEIDVGTTDFDMVMIAHSSSDNVTTTSSVDIVLKNAYGKGLLSHGGFINNADTSKRGATAQRTVTINGSKLNFSTATNTAYNAGGVGTVENNLACVPQRVYLIKLAS